jgi:uncharacterized membrane protein
MIRLGPPWADSESRAALLRRTTVALTVEVLSCTGMPESGPEMTRTRATVTRRGEAVVLAATVATAREVSVSAAAWATGRGLARRRFGRVTRND